MNKIATDFFAAYDYNPEDVKPLCNSYSKKATSFYDEVLAKAKDYLSNGKPEEARSGLLFILAYRPRSEELDKAFLPYASFVSENRLFGHVESFVDAFLARNEKDKALSFLSAWKPALEKKEDAFHRFDLEKYAEACDTLGYRYRKEGNLKKPRNPSFWD